MTGRAFVLALLFCSSDAIANQDKAAEDTKVSIYVSHSGKDRVGPQLAFAVREAIRRSAGYRLGSADESLFTVSLVSVDPDVRDDGIQTAAAVAITMRNLLPPKVDNPQTFYRIHLAQFIVLSGADVTDNQARLILTHLDEAVEGIRAAFPKK